MSATVPAYRPSVDASAVGYAKPVRAFTWQSAAALANYVRGRGSVLVPQIFPVETLAAGGAAGVYRFRLMDNPFSRRRVWSLMLRGATASAPTTCTIAINGGASVSRTLTSARAELVPLYLTEDVTSPDQTEKEISVSITPSATGAVEVISIGVYAMPQAALSYAVDGGPDLAMLRPVDPVMTTSLGSVALATSFTTTGALNGGRRIGMHHWAMNTAGTGKTTTSTSLVPLYIASGGAPALGRYLYSGDTTRLLTFKAYGKITGGATLTVTLTMTSGATTSITTTSAASVWFGTSNTIAVDAEDLTVSDGRRSARWDEIKIEFKTSSGAQTATLYSVSVWEDLQ